MYPWAAAGISSLSAHGPSASPLGGHAGARAACRRARRPAASSPPAVAAPGQGVSTRAGSGVDFRRGGAALSSRRRSRRGSDAPVKVIPNISAASRAHAGSRRRGAARGSRRQRNRRAGPPRRAGADRIEVDDMGDQIEVRPAVDRGQVVEVGEAVDGQGRELLPPPGRLHGSHALTSAVRARRPATSASGRGGQPGTYTLTGTSRSTPWVTVGASQYGPPVLAQAPNDMTDTCPGSAS